MDPTCTCTATRPLYRLLYDNSTGTSVTNPRIQLNAQTATLDASTVYGYNDARARLLRSFVNGYLISDPINGAPTNPNGYSMAGFTDPRIQRLAGDERANINPGILALQGLFVLEHNRWCDVLRKTNPTWTDETLYQEARRRVIALIQVITYNEYIPALLGQGLPAYTAYNPNVDPCKPSTAS